MKKEGYEPYSAMNKVLEESFVFNKELPKRIRELKDKFVFNDKKFDYLVNKWAQKEDHK